MLIFSPCRLYRLRLMRSLRPSLDATLRAAIAVQIGCPADLSRLSFCRQRARVHCAHPPAYNLQSLPLRKQGGRLWAQPCGRLSPCKLSVLTICPSTRATAMLSVAGARWRHKSARSRFGRPQDALCAMDGAHLKSCAIFASPGEKSGLAGD